MSARKGRLTTSGDPLDMSRNSSKRIMAAAFGQQLVFRVVGMLVNVVTITATTRYLGPAEYGELTTAVVFVALWTSLTELGIGSVIVRRVASGSGSLERLVRINAGMSLAYSLPLFLVSAATGAVVYRHDGDVVTMIVIVSSGLLATTISSCFQPVFIATVRFKAVAAADFTSRVAALGITLVLVHQQADLVWFAVVQLAPPLAVLAIQSVAASRIVHCRPIFNRRESWALLRESLPQTAVLIIGVLYWRIDGVILSLMSSPAEVGVYGLAYSLAFTISVLPGFLGTSTLSAMTRLHAEDAGRFGSFTAGTVELMMFFGLPIAVVGAFCAPDIVGGMSSTEFVSRGGPTLALLLIAACIGFLTGVLGQALFAAHDQVFLLKLNVVTLIVNIGLNVILAPRHGAIGAGVAMLVTEVIGLVVAVWRLRVTTTYRTPLKFAARLLVPIAATSTVVVGLEAANVMLALSCAVVAYLGLNLLIGPVTKDRLQSLWSDTGKQPGQVAGP